MIKYLATISDSRLRTTVNFMLMGFLAFMLIFDGLAQLYIGTFITNLACVDQISDLSYGAILAMASLLFYYQESILATLNASRLSKQVISLIIQVFVNVVIFESFLLNLQKRPWTLIVVILINAGHTHFLENCNRLFIAFTIGMYIYYILRISFNYLVLVDQIALSCLICLSQLIFIMKDRYCGQCMSLTCGGSKLRTYKSQLSHGLTKRLSRGQSRTAVDNNNNQLAKNSSLLRQISVKRGTSVEFLENIKNMISSGIVLLDAKMKIMFNNNQILKILKVSELDQLVENFQNIRFDSNKQTSGDAKPQLHAEDKSDSQTIKSLENIKMISDQIQEDGCDGLSIAQKKQREGDSEAASQKKQRIRMDSSPRQHQRPRQISERQYQDLDDIMPREISRALVERVNQMLSESTSLLDIIKELLRSDTDHKKSCGLGVSPRQKPKNNFILEINPYELVLTSRMAEKILQIKVSSFYYNSQVESELGQGPGGAGASTGQAKGKMSELSVAALIVVEDITKNMQAKHLEEMNNYKMKIIASISHKLKTPLNCSLNMLQMIVDDQRVDDNLLKNYVHPAYSSNLLLSSFICDICDYAQLEMNSFKLELQDFDVQQLVAECIDIFDHQARIKSILIDMETSPSKQLPTQIRSDPMRLRQILINLLSNSVKFSNNDGKIIVGLAYEASNKMLQIQVLDNGIGISEQQQTTLFRVWDQIQQSSGGGGVYGVGGNNGGDEGEHINNDNNKQVYMQTRGAGLGLTITAKLVKALSGNRRIQLESQLEKGSTFTFFIKNHDTNKKAVVVNDYYWASFRRLSLQSSLNQKGCRDGGGGDTHTLRFNSIESSNVLSNKDSKHNIMSPKLESCNLDESEFDLQSLISPSSFKPRFPNFLVESYSIDNLPIHKNHQRKKHKKQQSLQSCGGGGYNNAGIENSQIKEGALGVGCVPSQSSSSSIKSSQKNHSYKVTNSLINNNNESEQQLVSSSQQQIPSSKNIGSEKSISSGNNRHSMLNLSHIHYKARILENMQKIQVVEAEDDASPQPLHQCNCPPVLIVDDDSYNILALRSILQNLHMSSDTAENGQAAIDCVMERFNNPCCPVYKLIFMDIDMPIKNGYQATQEIWLFLNSNNGKIKKKSEIKNPIICACSAYVAEEDKAQAKKSGMQYFIEKPVIKSKLQAFISKMKL